MPQPNAIQAAAQLLDALVAALDGGAEAVRMAAEGWLRTNVDATALVVVDDERETTTPGASDRPAATTAIAAGGRVLGRLEASGADPDALAALAGALGACLLAAERFAALRGQAATDPLTGAGNRRAYEEYLDHAMAVAAARGRALTLMLFDIDDFKSYNDRFGHAAGDEVLRETVALLRAVIRRGDAVFRIGGDEFVVVFGDPESPRDPASPPIESVDQLAARFAERIRGLRLPALGTSGLGTLSVSAGLATFPQDGGDAATLLAAADARAMESKRRGKARITFGPGGELPSR